MSKRRLQILGLSLTFILIAGLSGYAGAWLLQRNNRDALLSGDLSSQRKIVTGESRLISQIARTVGPSVVSVNVPISNRVLAAGTGIVISEKGLIMTNRHVIPAGTNEISVTLSDGTELEDVSVVGRTNDNDSLDVAFLKINDRKGHKLTAAAIGDSSSVQVGDNVVAIGNALGQFQNTVTSGIISGFGRYLQSSGMFEHTNYIFSDIICDGFQLGYG